MNFFPVPPRRPIIVAKEGQLTASSTLAPMTAGQALSLSCETSGGKYQNILLDSFDCLYVS